MYPHTLTYTVTQFTGYIGLEAVEARSSGYPAGQQASYSISPTGRRNILQPCPQTDIFGELCHSVLRRITEMQIVFVHRAPSHDCILHIFVMRHLCACTFL